MSLIWIHPDVVLALHDEQIAQHGGKEGLRDRTLLESALFRPQHKDFYEDPSLTAIAAAYGFGIARNHPFMDGNKRTALVVTELFLFLNGYEVIASDQECLEIYLNLANGSLSESEFEVWLSRNVQKI